LRHQTTQNKAAMTYEPTTINYYKKIEDACASFGFTAYDDVAAVLQMMSKRNTTTFRMAGEWITVTYDANYEGNKYYKVEITE